MVRIDTFVSIWFKSILFVSINVGYFGSMNVVRIDTVRIDRGVSADGCEFGSTRALGIWFGSVSLRLDAFRIDQNMGSIRRTWYGIDS
jgi:hypothetical protein